MVFLRGETLLRQPAHATRADDHQDRWQDKPKANYAMSSRRPLLFSFY